MDDWLNVKNILAIVSVPLTFLLGLCGKHYQKICDTTDRLSTEVNDLRVVTGQQNVHIEHLSENSRKHADKLESLDNKIDEILKLLK